MRIFLALVLAAALAPTFTSLAGADPRPRDLMDAARLQSALRRLQTTGSVLFVAAHPDDENTAFLSYCVTGRGLRTAYLSITRGDGGQNLIGAETGAALGVIRTQELLAARRIDGAEQYFTRALDFGYSKTPEETLEIWGRERILGDVVWVIRRFQPDVIVTRFPSDGRGGHGHHTASAILAAEAFRAAGDPARFPEQLDRVTPWQAKRIVWNVFRPGTTPRDPKLPKHLAVDIGAYDARLARAFSEIAGQSRSMHKSQGFGAPERRGSILNTLEHVDGVPAESDFLDGVEITWKRVRGGEKIAALLHKAERAFDADRPAAIVPTLIEAEDAIEALPRAPWIDAKRRDLLEAIRSATGLWIEANAARPTAHPGGAVRLAMSVLNRSELPLALEKIELPGGATPRVTAYDSVARPLDAPVTLLANRPITAEATLTVPPDTPPSQPYWLRAPGGAGASEVADPRLVGTPENAPVLSATVMLALGGRRIAFEAPVVHRWVDPVQGERYRALEVAPRLAVELDRSAYLFPDAAPREVRVFVESADTTHDEASVRLAVPAGWRASPERVVLRFARGEREKDARFEVTPPANASSGMLAAEVVAGGERFTLGLERIDYPHLPIQTLFPPATARIARIDVRRAGSQIGYLMGSGDEVPDALRQMGYRVTLLTDEDVAEGDLARFDAIVAGVRAYNTRPRLVKLQPRLLEWVAGGGHLVVQYQTAEEGLGDRLGPFPFTISRDRVTVEDAPMTATLPQHPVLVSPNPIGIDDWSGWVQERGLYFANPHDPRYEAPLVANDPGEPARPGGLIVARHGRGTFVYTGLAWFRQLPAGVPGAYRLFANLVSPTGRP